MTQNVELLELDGFAPLVGDQFICDVREAVIDRAEGDAGWLRGIRIFLDHIAKKQDFLNARRLATLLRDSKCREPTATHLLVGELNEWIEWELRECRYAPDYLRRQQQTVAVAFAALSDLEGSRYPFFQRSFVRWKHLPPDNEKATLGRRPWMDLDGLTGIARERTALQLLQKHALAAFAASCLFAETGQSIIMRETSSTGQFDDLRRAADLELACLAKEGRSDGRVGPFVHKGLDPTVVNKLRNPGYWIKCGLSPTIFQANQKILTYPEVGFLIRSCMAPNRELTYSLGLVTSSYIGWNKQPIFCLPRELYFFSTHDQYTVATERWIRSFKERAGHDVIAYLARSELSGGRLDSVNKIARETDAVFQRSAESALIDKDHALVELFSRYDGIRSKYEDLTSTNPFPDDFFFNVTSGGPTRTFRPPNYWANGYLMGADFNEVRGSFAKIGIREVPSIEALRARMGHKGNQVLYPYYVGDEDLQREQLESFRFYQNCCEALFLDGKLGSIKLNLVDADRRWFSNLAHVSGLAAVFGLYERSKDEKSEDGSEDEELEDDGGFVFIPSDKNLADLFVIHIELKRQRGVLDARRWYIQGMPQLAVAKALISAVLDAGLGGAYARAAKAAYAKLRRGDILRPILF